MTGTSPYQSKADQFSFHAQIAALVRKLSLSASTDSFVALNVGCATRFLRRFLPEPHFYISGINQDLVAVVRARKQYDEVYQATLTLELVLPPQRLPQVMFLADILEHLPSPEQVLTHLLHQYAKPGAQIVISLPNIAHLYVHLGLLLGRFEYTELRDKILFPIHVLNAFLASTFKGLLAYQFILSRAYVP